MLGVTGQLRATLVASTGTTVALLVALLLALGVAMIAVAVWLVRSTRADHPALGPLETMGDRSFRRASTDRRATSLAAARPPGAPDPAPIVPLEEESEPEPVAPAEPSDATEGPGEAADEPAAAKKCEPRQRESASTAHTSETEHQPEVP